MDIATIIAEAMQVLNIGQLVIKAAEDATPYIEMAKQILTGTALSPAQRATMLADEARLTAELNADTMPGDQP